MGGVFQKVWICLGVWILGKVLELSVDQNSVQKDYYFFKIFEVYGVLKIIGLNFFRINIVLRV